MARTNVDCSAERDGSTPRVPPDAQGAGEHSQRGGTLITYISARGLELCDLLPAKELKSTEMKIRRS
jgi:hypothetical protein